MKNIKRISLVLTMVFLFSFLYFVASSHAQMGKVMVQVASKNENCTEISKNLKVRLNKTMTVHKRMDHALKNDARIDKYNRHINILVGNLNREVNQMEDLLSSAEQGECNKLVQVMRDRVTNARNIYQEMMAAMQKPGPKELLTQQNEKLKSELDHLIKANLELSST